MPDFCPFVHQQCKDRMVCQQSGQTFADLYSEARTKLRKEPRRVQRKWVRDHFKGCPQAIPLVTNRQRAAALRREQCG